MGGQRMGQGEYVFLHPAGEGAWGVSEYRRDGVGRNGVTVYGRICFKI